MKFRVSVSTRAFTDIIIERENASGEGWTREGWPVLTPEEIKEISKTRYSDWEIVQTPDELEHFLEIEEFEEAGPEYA